MAGFTNRGKARLLEGFLRNIYRDKDGNSVAFPTSWKVGLYTLAAADPTADNDLFLPASEPTNGGYSSGGLTLERSATGWDTMTEDDTNDKGIIKGKDIVFTATGTTLGPVQWAILTDDVGTIANRQSLFYWQIDAAGVSVSAGQSLTLIDLTLELRES
jgi:hypothetical protein